MITYDKKEKIMDLTCNMCDHEETFNGEWVAAFATAKQAGWSAHKDGEEWKHCCGQACRDLFFTQRR